MTTKNKHTKRDLFTNLLVLASAAESEAWVIEGIEHELELLNRKRTTDKGADAKRKAEIAEIKNDITVVLTEADEPLRVAALAALVGQSPQRVTALVTQMVNDGEVIREVAGKVATFRLA